MATDKLTFSFQGAVKVRFDNKEIDLEKAGTAFNYAGRDAAKHDTLKGFDAGNGTFFRLKRKPDGSVDVIVYGPPEQLEKYRFKVSRGEFSKARFRDGEFRSSDHRARDFQLDPGDLAAASRQALQSRFNLAAHSASSTRPTGIERPPVAGDAGFSALEVSLRASKYVDDRVAALDLADDDRLSLSPAGHAPVVGLPNLGNTCYLNSTLKILFASNWPQTRASLERAAGKPPCTFQIGDRQPYDELRQTLLQVGERSFSTSNQPAVDEAMKTLVALLESPELRQAVQPALLEYREAAGLEQQTVGDPAQHMTTVALLDERARQAGYDSYLDQKTLIESLHLIGQYGGSAVRSEQDMPDCLGWLSGIMRIAPHPDETIQSRQTITTVDGTSWPSGQPITEPMLRVMSPPGSSGLASLIAAELAPVSVELADAGGDATKRLELVANLASLTRFAIRIDGDTPLSSLDFNAEVSVPMTDLQSNAPKTVVFRPREVVFHETRPEYRHYYAYIREGDTWIRHDDSTVEPGEPPAALGPNLRPRIIVLEKLRIEDAA